MEPIKVNKGDLIEQLTKNRAKHRKIFEEALEGYKKAVIVELEKRLERAKKGKRINHVIQLLQPQDQTKDYDRAIGMLRLSTELEVSLTERDYQQYVLDDWSWKNQFMTSNAMYSKTASDMVTAIADSEFAKDDEGEI